MKLEAEIIGENGVSYSENLDEILLTARSAFGIKYLFPWQNLVVSNILDCEKSLEEDASFSSHHDDDSFCRGRQIVLLPTGAGKSLCFLLPSLLLKGKTLVIYPLIALMADQQRRMEDSGISCVMFRGGQTTQEREENFNLLKGTDGGKQAKVIIANPEILQDKNLVKRLSECNISHIAIDEAHCVAEWGDSFRSAYLSLGSVIRELGTKIITAFTATASPPVLKRVGEVLFDGQYHLVQGASDRANIHYEVRLAYAKQKEALRCAKVMRKPMIIFCGTRRRTEDMARLLTAYFGDGKAKFYHAGMTKEEKNQVEKWFFDSDDGILTATCAYGMGMDKGNIYTVVHLDAPEHIENFAQEAGRAGRKGDDVHSVLIWNHADEIRYRQARPHSREKAMGDFVHAKTCRREVLLDCLGGEKTVCSGCDICDAKKKGVKLPDTAWDADTALQKIKKNRRIFKKEEAVKEIFEELNEKTIQIFKMNIWEAKDVAEILSQLFSERKIRVCGGLWENRLDIVKRTAKRGNILRVIPRKTLRHLHLLRRLVRQVLEPEPKRSFFWSALAFFGSVRCMNKNQDIKTRQPR